MFYKCSFLETFQDDVLFLLCLKNKNVSWGTLKAIYCGGLSLSPLLQLAIEIQGHGLRKICVVCLIRKSQPWSNMYLWKLHNHHHTETHIIVAATRMTVSQNLIVFNDMKGKNTDFPTSEAIVLVSSSKSRLTTVELLPRKITTLSDTLFPLTPIIQLPCFFSCFSRGNLSWQWFS